MGNRLLVRTIIKAIPNDDREVKDIVLKSHWLYSDRVELEIGKERVTVLGRDLIKAIQNCMNCD